MEGQICEWARGCSECLLDYEALLKESQNIDKTLYDIEIKRYNIIYEDFVKLFYRKFTDGKPYEGWNDFRKLGDLIYDKYKSFKLLVNHTRLLIYEREIEKLKLEIDDMKERIKKLKPLYDKAKAEYEKKVKNDLDLDSICKPDEKLIKAQKIYDEARNNLDSVSDTYKELKPFKACDYYYRIFSNSYEDDYRELCIKSMDVKYLLSNTLSKLNEAILLLK